MFFVAMKYATFTYTAFGPINPSSASHPYQAFVRRCAYVSTLWPSKTNTSDEGKKTQDSQRNEGERP